MGKNQRCPDCKRLMKKCRCDEDVKEARRRDEKGGVHKKTGN